MSRLDELQEELEREDADLEEIWAEILLLTGLVLGG